MAIDPVCKMEVDESSAEWTAEYQGKTYYFCAPSCRDFFVADPQKYLSGEESGSGVPGERQGHDDRSPGHRH